MKRRESLQQVSVLLFLLSCQATFFLPILSVGLSWILLALTLTVGVSVLLLALTLVGGGHQESHRFLLSKDMHILLKIFIFFQLISFSLASVLHLVIVFLPVITGGLLTVTLILIGLLGASTLLYMVYGAFEVVSPYKQPLSHKSDEIEQKPKTWNPLFQAKNRLKHLYSKLVPQHDEIKISKVIKIMTLEDFEAAWKNMSDLEDDDRINQLSELKQCDVSALLDLQAVPVIIFRDILSIIPLMRSYLDPRDFKEQIHKFSPFFQKCSTNFSNFCMALKSFLRSIHGFQEHEVILKEDEWKEGVKLFFATDDLKEIEAILQEKIDSKEYNDGLVDHIKDLLGIVKDNTQMQCYILFEVVKYNRLRKVFLHKNKGSFSSNRSRIFSKLTHEASVKLLEAKDESGENFFTSAMIQTSEDLIIILKQSQGNKGVQEFILNLLEKQLVGLVQDNVLTLKEVIHCLDVDLALRVFEMLENNDESNEEKATESPCFLVRFVKNFNDVLTLIRYLDGRLQLKILETLYSFCGFNQWIRERRKFIKCMEILSPDGGARHYLFNHMRTELLDFDMKNSGLLHILCYLDDGDKKVFLASIIAENHLDWIEDFEDLSFVVALDQEESLKTVISEMKQLQSDQPDKFNSLVSNVQEDLKRLIEKCENEGLIPSPLSLFLNIAIRLSDAQLESEFIWFFGLIEWKAFSLSEVDALSRLSITVEAADSKFQGKKWKEFPSSLKDQIVSKIPKTQLDSTSRSVYGMGGGR